ncbi:hypothetical protein C4D60_Mb04t08290 [Musa balbisiana]|uniref:Uncharacterized protein n=1 Tax=Musa balbisiana TaxID=52838 RepID=A0A4S8KAH7_MUSBA|nr:hypothetical protein C4D60_Mb04t08290 [Musa balbisiana]
MGFGDPALPSLGATGIVAVASTAIMAAASYSTAVSGSPSDPKLQAPNQVSGRPSTSAITSNQGCCVRLLTTLLSSDTMEQGRASSSQEKQKQEDGSTPRFDGLRFIESLVTAHR